MYDVSLAIFCLSQMCYDHSRNLCLSQMCCDLMSLIQVFHTHIAVAVLRATGCLYQDRMAGRVKLSPCNTLVCAVDQCCVCSRPVWCVQWTRVDSTRHGQTLRPRRSTAVAFGCATLRSHTRGTSVDENIDENCCYCADVRAQDGGLPDETVTFHAASNNTHAHTKYTSVYLNTKCLLLPPTARVCHRTESLSLLLTFEA